MCECIEKLHEKLKPEIHGRFAKKNKDVMYFNIRTTMSGNAIVNMSIYLAKQMKPVESFILAAYCPWCGVKYDAHNDDATGLAPEGDKS